MDFTTGHKYFSQTTNYENKTIMKTLNGTRAEPCVDIKETALDAAPESERWDPVPGSIGHKVSVAPSEDEDEEGRSDNERLVDEGMAGAELDQALQAASSAAKADS